MTYVGLVSDRRGRWAEAGRRMAAAPHAPAAFAALLGALATAEAGSVLPVRSWLGRHGALLRAAGRALPFLVRAPAPPALAQARIPAVLLAALGPSAAWAGAAHRSRSEAVEHSAARQAIAGTLLEHTARGERARISRELHDVVAHHISMIAVQAETARLPPPGMPAAGAQRLASIGDTARAALTEMRRLLGVLREDTRAAVAARRPQPGLRPLHELLGEGRGLSGAGPRPHVMRPP